MRVAEVSVETVKIPLTASYHLAYGSLTSVTSDVVRIALEDGRRGSGEAVALPGYTRETQDEIHAALACVAPRLPGRETDEAIRYVKTELQGQRFASSALVTALEWATGAIPFPARISIPLAAPLAAGTEEEVLAEADRLLRAGYRTLKVKIGRDPSADIATARTLLEHLPDGATVRFDANQGYSTQALSRLLHALNHPRRRLVEYIEQPLRVEAWAAMEDVCKSSDVPFMLDESIQESGDVRRAAAIGAGFVKLKLFKHAGMGETLRLAQEATELGLGVVFGNGVSTDVCNLAEALVWSSRPDLFHGAFEGNGFAKLHSTLLDNPPTVQGGRFTWASAKAPDLKAPLMASRVL